MDTYDWPIYYGVLDATAVARYFGLKSEELGVDYSAMDYERVEVPSEPVYPDATGPELLVVEGLSKETDSMQVHAAITAEESDSTLLYYSYSLDGGETYAPLETWPEGVETIVFDIPIEDSRTGNLVIAVYNNYNVGTFSENYRVAAIRTLQDIQVAQEACGGIRAVRACGVWG